MLTEDHIIRMINVAIAALLRIIGLKKSGSYEEALQIIDLTFEQLLGLRMNMVKGLEDNKLYHLLTSQGQLDTIRLGIISDLFLQEGDILAAQNRLEESRESYNRAMRYALEAFFQEQPDPRAELEEKIVALTKSLSLEEMGSDTLWPLMGYYEETHSYARAEQVLLHLTTHPDSRAEISGEVIAFYERMVQKPDDELAKAGLQAADMRAKLARWKGKEKRY